MSNILNFKYKYFFKLSLKCENNVSRFILKYSFNKIYVDYIYIYNFYSKLIVVKVMFEIMSISETISFTLSF